MAYRWRMDGSPRWKKNKSLGKSTKQSDQTHEEIKGNCGELGESSMSSFEGRSQAEKPRWSDAGLGTTLCEKHHNQANLRAITRDPKKVRKRWAKWLYAINIHTTRRIRLTECHAVLTSYWIWMSLGYFEDIWGPLHTKCHFSNYSHVGVEKDRDGSKSKHLAENYLEITKTSGMTQI